MRTSEIFREDVQLKVHTQKKLITETRSVGRILLELNVMNIPAIDKYLKQYADRLPQKLQKWFIAKTKKYLVNSEENNVQVTRFSANAEPWMKQRQKEGVALYRFDPTHQLSTDLNNSIDWINATFNISNGTTQSDPTTKQRAVKEIKGLNNTTITDVIQKANTWHEKLATQKQNPDADISVKDEEKEGLEFVLSVDDNYAWFKLTTHECLNREGNRMGHCVGSYGHRVESGDAIIYSLRDKNNRPRITVEVVNDEIAQIKGKGNHPPIAKYIPASLALLNHLKVPTSNYGTQDLKAMGILWDKENEEYHLVKDHGELLYSDKDSMLRKVIDSDSFNNKVKIWHIKDGQLINTLDYEENSKKNQPDYEINESITDNDVELNELLSKYVNSLPIKKRPIVHLSGLYQNLKTYQLSTKLSEVTEPLVSNGSCKAYEVMPNRFDSSSTTYIIITLNKDILFKIQVDNNTWDGILNLRRNEEVNLDKKANLVVSVLNGILNKRLTDKQVPLASRSDIEKYGIFYNNIDQKFTTDIRAGGEHYKNDVYNAVKTARNVYIFKRKHKVLTIELKAQYSRYSNRSVGEQVESINIHDYIDVLGNARQITDIIKYYGLKRNTTKGVKVNKDLAKIGINYRKNDWVGTKTKPKKIFTVNVDNKEYEVYKIRKIYPVRDEGNRHIFSLDLSDKDAHIISTTNVPLDNLHDIIIEVTKELKEQGIDFDFGWLNIPSRSMHDNKEKIRNFVTNLEHKNKLWLKGYNGDGTNIEEDSPTETILQIKEGRWVKEAFNKIDYSVNAHKIEKALSSSYVTERTVPTMISPNDISYTFYKKSTALIRLISDNSTEPGIQKIRIRDNSTIRVINVEDVEKYKDILAKLIQKLGLSASFFIKHGYYYSKGKLVNINENPKLKGYLRGKIAYEDGHIWVRQDSYRTDITEWSLKLYTDEESYPTTILQVKMADDGIKNISFEDNRTRRNTKLYRPYLLDILDINDELHGDAD